jgi:hypothetical protein
MGSATYWIHAFAPVIRIFQVERLVKPASKTRDVYIHAYVRVPRGRSRGWPEVHHSFTEGVGALCLYVDIFVDCGDEVRLNRDCHGQWIVQRHVIQHSNVKELSRDLTKEDSFWGRVRHQRFAIATCQRDTMCDVETHHRDRPGLFENDSGGRGVGIDIELGGRRYVARPTRGAAHQHNFAHRSDDPRLTLHGER